MITIKKDFWKGYSKEQLMEMPLDQFLKLLNSRERRALKRALEETNMEYKMLIDKVRKMKKSGKVKPVKTHCREAVIIPEWLGMRFLVYNGKEWRPVDIDLQKLGRRLGEFSFPVKFIKHSGPGVGATRGSKFIPLK